MKTKSDISIQILVIVLGVVFLIPPLRNISMLDNGGKFLITFGLLIIISALWKIENFRLENSILTKYNFLSLFKRKGDLTNVVRYKTKLNDLSIYPSYRAFKKDEQMKRIIFVILILFPFLTVYSIKPDRKYRFYPEKLGLIYKEIKVVTPDGLKIKTWFYPAQDSLTQTERENAWNNPRIKPYQTIDEQKRPTIIICNGDASNMSWQQYYMVMAYTAKGYNVATFDWRGFGESDEWEMNTDYLVYTEMLIDYNSVIEEIIKQPEVISNRIALIGWSTGAYLSMAAASKRPEVKCYVGQALMTSFEEVIPTLRKIEKFKEKILIVPSDYPEELNPIELAPKFDKSTFLIVGEKDDRTPVWMSKKIIEKMKGDTELWIVPEAVHGGPDGPTKNFNLYNQKILEFMDKYL